MAYTYIYICGIHGAFGNHGGVIILCAVTPLHVDSQESNTSPGPGP